MTILFNAMTIVLTVGYFFEETNQLYQQNQLNLLMVTAVSVILACVGNDKLHHVLMGHIMKLDSYRNELQQNSSVGISAEKKLNMDNK